MATPAADRTFGAPSRLRSRRDFDRAFQGGRKAVNRQLVAWVREAPDVERSRLGLSVGRRVGNAVRRNRVKRCLREAFRELRGGWPDPIEMVLIVRPAHAPTTLAEATAALEHVLKVWRRGPRSGSRAGGRRRVGGEGRQDAPTTPGPPSC